MNTTILTTENFWESFKDWVTDEYELDFGCSSHLIDLSVDDDGIVYDDEFCPPLVIPNVVADGTMTFEEAGKIISNYVCNNTAFEQC